MSDKHPINPAASFDGGNLDCGNGLLLLIRRHIDPLEAGQYLEILSRESSVSEDLPAWCRLTGNPLVSVLKKEVGSSYLVCKGSKSKVILVKEDNSPTPKDNPPQSLPVVPTPKISELAVMGIGSWPRPIWMLRALKGFSEQKISEEEFHLTADDAVKLCVQAQLDVGVDVVTDGEQRRDNYSSFVASRLENTQLIPLSDLLALVDDPEKFSKELEALDIPASEVRHPGVFGKISRRRSLAVHEFTFVQKLTEKPVKIALPGPYLLTRTMWIDCLPETIYKSREEIAVDLVKVLREEIADLLAAGVALIQLDEPVLTEVVFTPPKVRRSFMCGALSEKSDSATELGFATELLNAVVAGFPSERLALHVCRGNWSRDESLALNGSYEALIPTFNKINVGNFLLEFCTERAGSLDVLKNLRGDVRVGVGCVNQKLEIIESEDFVKARVKAAIEMLGKDRVLLVPDCGFATFADNPLSSEGVARGKLEVLVRNRNKLSID